MNQPIKKWDGGERFSSTLKIDKVFCLQFLAPEIIKLNPSMNLKQHKKAAKLLEKIRNAFDGVELYLESNKEGKLICHEVSVKFNADKL